MGRPLLAAGLIVGLAPAPLACARSHSEENAAAKARIFQRAEDEAPPPLPAPIDVGSLGGSTAMQDRMLEMTEEDLAKSVGSFRLRAKLSLRFDGRL